MIKKIVQKVRKSWVTKAIIISISIIFFGGVIIVVSLLKKKK
jgi:hypothetical protein